MKNRYDTVELGGFSGLFFDGVADNGNLKFLTVADRGPDDGDPTEFDSRSDNKGAEPWALSMAEPMPL